jgi:hypothetical protein
MLSTLSQVLAYYTAPAAITDPGEHAARLDNLPRDIPTLCKLVQGVMVHVFWAKAYGLELSDDRKQEVNLRTVNRILSRIIELDDRPLTEARPLDKKIVGNCRDHSTLLVAILRHQGIPARARCGFGAYFVPNHYVDHWVCEYWNADQERWILVDAQLDDVQCNALKIAFDPNDVPRDQFVVGGQGWQMCRAGKADPDTFGIFEWKGLWFVQDDMIRDLVALNKIELLPWDGWGLMRGPDDPPLSDDDLTLLDHIAGLTTRAGNETFDEIRALVETDPRLQPPPEWKP